MRNYKQIFYQEHKSLSDFTPHSLMLFQETASNKEIKTLLIQINLYYSRFKTEPPIDYLVFACKSDNPEQIETAIKFLCMHGWFSLVKSCNQVKGYSIKDKFRKAFYHDCGRW